MDVRDQLLKHLATPDADTRFSESYLVGQISQATGCRSNQVWEALWGLVADGLVYLDPAGQGSGTDNWLWRLSATGIKVATGGPWDPRDINGYLRRLREHTPPVDPAAIKYMEEALRAFNARCYLATSVMLGVASERVVLGLAQSVVDARGDRAKKLSDALDNPRTSQATRFGELRKQLEPLRSQLPSGLADTLTLDAIADLLRLTRNEAGHPTGTDVDEDTAFIHLQMAAGYVQKMTTLEAFFRAEWSDEALSP